MAAIELVTNRCHLIPIENTSAKSLIRALETLQGPRGRLSTIIVDETKSQQVLKREPNFALKDLLLGTKTPLLAKAGVSVLITPGKHHKPITKLETIIKKIKKVIISVLGSFNFTDVWDFST